MAMVVAMALPAMAASIEVTDTATSNHVYKVYQIFTGTLFEKTDADTGEKTQVLSDIEYGSNYTGNGTAGITAATEAKAIETNSVSARDFATILKDGNTANGEISGDPVATLNAANEFKATGLADGYYLIIDETPVTGEGSLEEGDMLSRYIVQVIGSAEIAPKKSTVEEHKKIKQDTHSPSDVTTDKTADDLSIGESVTYVIDATVPENAVDFDKFFFVINDTLSTGLTLDTTSFSVYTKEGNTTTNLAEKTDYTLFVVDPAGTVAENLHTAPDSGKTWQIALKNPKSLAGKTVYVEYSATLNENAAIGEVPNTNKTTVQYSNNPEHDYDGEDNNNDGKPDELNKTIYGETPEQETKTFTSSIQLKKTDGTNALQGAKFKITGTSVKTVLITSDVYEEDATSGTYYKLKDGTYTTVAPAEEDFYVEKGTVPGTDYNVNDGGYVLDGENNYVVATYDQLMDSTTTIYAKVTATKDQYEDPVQGAYKKYKKTTKTEAVKTSETISAEAFVDANGIVRFDGLGAGTYTITETQTPAGYNTIDPFTVTITFDKDDADKDTTNDDTADTDALVWKATSDFAKTTGNTTGSIAEKDSADADTVLDTFEIEVINQKGTELPSTGGIGTTIFYVVGAILVIGAGVILITRRKMDA